MSKIKRINYFTRLSVISILIFSDNLIPQDEEKNLVVTPNVTINTEKKSQDSKKIGINLDAFYVVIDRWLILLREAEELKVAGQSIKAERKIRESDQAKREIENFFKVGRSISATPECPFEVERFHAGFDISIEKQLSILKETRAKMGNLSADYIDSMRGLYGQRDQQPKPYRAFRLTCFDRSQEKDYDLRSLIFYFTTSSERDSYFPTGAQTSDEIAETFESGSHFTGLIQTVGGELRVLRTQCRLFDFESTCSQVQVNVKIISLQILNR